MEDDEIEITDEMMEAGLSAYADWFPGDWRPEPKVRAIYIAMARAKKEVQPRPMRVTNQRVLPQFEISGRNGGNT